MTPNDPKLSDGGGRQPGCGDADGVAAAVGAAGMTPGAVRCSAWLGDLVLMEYELSISGARARASVWVTPDQAAKMLQDVKASDERKATLGRFLHTLATAGQPDANDTVEVVSVIRCSQPPRHCSGEQPHANS